MVSGLEKEIDGQMEEGFLTHFWRQVRNRIFFRVWVSFSIEVHRYVFFCKISLKLVPERMFK